MPKENNKMQVDIENLFKQNVNDLLSIKELYKRIEELGEKISQIKYIDNTLIKKLKKEYERLKEVNFDVDLQIKLTNDIETINEKLNNDIETINEKLNNDIETINLQIDSKANESEVIKKGKVDLDEMTERTLQAIQGGQGATFNLLSIPRDGSVTVSKTDFLITNENILNIDEVDDGKYFIDYKPWFKEGSGYSSIKIPVSANVSYSSTDVYTNFTMFENSTGKRTKFMSTSTQLNKITNYIPSEDGYLCLSFPTNIKANTMLVNSSVLPSEYKQFNEAYNINLKGMNLKGFESDLIQIKENTDSIIPIYNHVKPSDIIREKYFIDYKPWVKDGVGYSCVKVPVFKGLSYSTDEVFTAFTMFEDLTGKRTKFLDTSKQLVKIIDYSPIQDGFLCLSFQSSIADRFMLVNSKYAPTKYTQYKKPYSYILGDIDTNIISKKYDEENDIYYDLSVITVAKDGSGNFDNLVDAYNSIQNNSINNRHLIKVKKGVYDFGEKFNSVTATNYVGIVLNKHYVYFEGENPTNTILYFDGCPTGTNKITTEQAYRVALFHWGVKNTFKGHIKNFTLRAKNCRYTIHPETASQGNGGDWKIENVIFDFLGNSNVDKWKGASVGIGISCGEKGYFKNCKWTNFDRTVEGIVGHNNGYDYTDKPFIIPNCQLTFENCDFGNTIIHVDNYKNVSGFYDIFKLINCTNIARGYFGHQDGQQENVWRCINKGSKIIVDEFDY